MDTHVYIPLCTSLHLAQILASMLLYSCIDHGHMLQISTCLVISWFAILSVHYSYLLEYFSIMVYGWSYNWYRCDVMLFRQPEQLTKIFELCGTPDDVIWPGVTKMPWYNNFKPPRPLKRRVKEFFKQWVIFDMFWPIWLQVLIFFEGQTWSLATVTHSYIFLQFWSARTGSVREDVDFRSITGMLHSYSCEFYKKCYLLSFAWLVLPFFGY